MNTILNSQEDAHYKRGSAKNSDKRRRFSLPLTSYWRYGLSLLALTYNLTPLAFSQKKPLDHEVYDGWQSISSANISKNGKYVYFLVSPQEGDSKLYIKDALNHTDIGEIERASNVSLSPSETHLILTIKPRYQETREARIQKKRPDEMPKDTLAIFDLRSQTLLAIPSGKSIKLPSEKGHYVAYQLEKPREENTKSSADSVARRTKEGEELARPSRDARGSRETRAPRTETVLALHHLERGLDTTFQNVSEYFFSKDGQFLYMVRKPEAKDSVGHTGGVFQYDIAARSAKVLSSGKGEYKSFAFDKDENQLAFLAYKGDTKVQNKRYSIYFHKVSSGDTAKVLVDSLSSGIPAGWQLSEHGNLRFSNDGTRLFFGVAPTPRFKDTTLVDFEHAKVDIWHWQDDFLQTEQLVNLRRDLNKNYLSVVELQGPQNRVLVLADPELPEIRLPIEGSQQLALGVSDFGKRLESQWRGGSAQDVYLVDTYTGQRNLIKSNLWGTTQLSPNGKYVLWFDREEGNWYVYDVHAKQTRMLNAQLDVSFADEDNDVPDFPNSYGIAGWGKDDASVFINDKYDVWMFDLVKQNHRCLTNGWGRQAQITLRYSKLEPKPKDAAGTRSRRGIVEPIDPTKPLWLSAFNHVNKDYGWFKTNPKPGRNPEQVVMGAMRYTSVQGAEQVRRFIYTKESFAQSPDLYVSEDFIKETKLSATNPQQADYNWGTVELFHWTTPNGRAAQGLLYKPEDFDPNKKYPVIAYFYERVSNELNHYVPPSPTPSKLNIPFFVSNGYVVFTPDIHYETGYPGRAAEEYVNSGMQALCDFPWVDETALGIQGQSWGGYQVAHLITRTDMYAAAWAGAPVVNMTSAYGGIRWQTGKNRQFQYERTQSRLGASLWERQDLYIENSPLFYMDRVRTPVAIMHNDEDGAVPWYQGIEMFTALRRLGKPVWMLNYNGDGHNLMQRQNRKDIQRRQHEFFDHFLKGKPAAPWIEKGVPAVLKGIDWGFRTQD